MIAPESTKTTFMLVENGYAYDTVEAANLDAALVYAVANIDTSCHDDGGHSTFWVEVEARRLDEDGDVIELASKSVQVDPAEPACSAAEAHAWEQVGLRGSGGGVEVTDRCRHCGVECIVDTWAQNPVNGEQGLRSTTYNVG